MKLGELLNINKSLEEKKKEILLLEEKKKYLEEEIKKLEIMKIRNSDEDSDLVDIKNLWVIEKSGITYFARLGTSSSGHKIYFNFFDGSIAYYKYAQVGNLHVDITPIRERFKEISAYPNGMVPRKLLEFLYYKANNIDSRMLKMCYDIKE